MQVCPECGAEVKYIATGHNAIVLCDGKPLTVVNERGHKFTGYPVHICEKAVKTDEGLNAESKQQRS